MRINSFILILLTFFITFNVESRRRKRKKKKRIDISRAVAPQNIGGVINTNFKEAMPCISGNGKVLIYQTNKIIGDEEDVGSTGEENWDLWVSYKTDSGSWSTPNVLEGVNSDYFDGHPSLSVDGKRLYFTSNRPSGGSDMNIWFTELFDGSWKKPHKLSSLINSSSIETFPSIGPKGRQLFFARLNGIFKAKYISGKWGRPQRLSSTINAGYKETAPSFHVDGSTLYFSSQRPGGRGGYDLYMSRLKRNKWSRPKHMGQRINGPGNDLFVSIPASGKILYFASIRPGGYGSEDIYTVPLPPALAPRGVTLVSGTITHKASGKRVKAKIEVIDLKSNAVIERRQANEKGQYSVILDSGKRYGVIISSAGFYFLSASFNLKEEKQYREIKRDFSMLTLGSPGRLILNNIFFAKGSAKLLKESGYEMQRLAKLLKVNSNIRLEIQGHTDNRGSRRYNKKLSLKRAKSVRNYLLNNNIAASRLSAIGFGSEKPIASNRTKEGRQKNRRTEFRILQ